MARASVSKTNKQAKKISADAAARLSPLLERAQKLLGLMLDTMEMELAQCDAAGRHELLFGTRGIMAQMPKLVQLASQLTALHMDISAAEAPQDAAAHYPPISAEDLQLLKTWLES